MKISINWLNSYLDKPIDGPAADQVLTNLGFPIDETTLSPTDTLLDVEVTSNRGDCLSHIGVAREIAAATGRTLLMPRIDEPDNSNAPKAASIATVTNTATEACPRYTARILRGVKVAPSPAWLAERITAIGLRPVNNVVDVTNFVLHETGQPLHAFDLAKLKGPAINVRMAADGEPFTAIDGSKHKLKAGMLVIADAQRPVALAGIMGGLDSEVSDTTVDLLLESARFAPLAIRTTSRALRMSSDSSYRFERTMDPNAVEWASARAAQLILMTAGGALCPDLLDAGAGPVAPITIHLRPDRCRQLLGIDIPTSRMIEILQRLGLSPEAGADGSLTCTIPTFRRDLEREVDLIEEIVRVHGLDQVKTDEKIRLTVTAPQNSIKARRAISQVLVAHGYCQTITISFLPPADAQAFMAPGLEALRVDEEKKKADPTLRPSLLPSLMHCRKTNQDAGNRGVKLFEIARVFARRDGKPTDQPKLAMLMDLPGTDAEAGLRNLRGTLEDILRATGLGARAIFAEAQPGQADWADPAGVLMLGAAGGGGDGGVVIGRYGRASDAILKQFDLQSPVLLAELDYPSLEAAYPPAVGVRALPRFPAIERDLSVVVDEKIRWSRIADLIAGVKVPLLEEVRFVTVYRGKQVGAGRKSVTFSLTFRDPARTLQHEEVTTQVNSVVQALAQQVKAELRQ